MKKFATVDAYLRAQPPAQRAALERLRSILLAALPRGTEEIISYGMPAYRYEGGRPVVYFGGFKDHMSLFPASSGILDGFARELRGFDVAKGTVRFTAERPLPATLVRKIVKARLAEIERAREVKRRSR